MMTYRKMVFIHILQLTFVAGSVVLVLTAYDRKLLIVCLLCSAIFHVRCMVWWYRWVHKILRFTTQLSDRRARLPKPVAEPFLQIEKDLWATRQKLTGHQAAVEMNLPAIDIDTEEKELDNNITACNRRAHLLDKMPVGSI